MKAGHLFSALLVMSLLGCAGGITKPVAVQPLTRNQNAPLHISEISAEAAPGVVMAQWELDRISQRVKAELAALSPSPMVTPGDPSMADALKMKLVFTKYDRGNAFARAMLAGLGQIKIKADVLLVDAAGTTVGKYEVSKDFAFGGIYGAATRPEDVEEGFAKSVAEIVKTKATKREDQPTS